MIDQEEESSLDQPGTGVSERQGRVKPLSTGDWPADWCLIPSHMHDAMLLYLFHGIEPGSFLTAVLCNNLAEAAGRADHINQNKLFDYVRFLYNYAPATCWGNPERVRAWINAGGFNGYRETQAGREDEGNEA